MTSFKIIPKVYKKGVKMTAGHFFDMLVNAYVYDPYIKDTCGFIGNYRSICTIINNNYVFQIFIKTLAPGIKKKKNKIKCHVLTNYW